MHIFIQWPLVWLDIITLFSHQQKNTSPSLSEIEDFYERNKK
jgi:hypothetical protein